MTDDEKKKLLEGFRKPVQDDQHDPWTEEEILKAAKRIIDGLGLTEELQ